MRLHANLILLESLEAVYSADGELVVCPWDLESEIPEADDESAQLFADDEARWLPPSSTSACLDLAGH